MRVKKHAMALGIGFLCISNAFAGGSSASDREQQVIAKILMEFPRYVKIDTVKARPALCIVGRKNLFTTARALNDVRKTYSDVRLFNAQLALCDFIYSDDTKQARQLIADAADYEVITISNYHNFIDEGGAIGVVNINGTISIELNLSTANEKQAVFSPDLIELSQRVIQ